MTQAQNSPDGHFAMVVKACSDRNLSPATVRLYAVLRWISFDSSAHIYRKDVYAEEIPLSERSTRRAIKQLVEQGWIAFGSDDRLIFRPKSVDGL